MLSLWLAVAVIMTSIAFPTYTEGAASCLPYSMATPSTATRSTATRSLETLQRATPSSATPSTATSSMSDAVFERVEPETIPEYYRSANYHGKKFWKFIDRNGKIQYRDYGFKQGEVEFPLWYETDGKGSIKDLINEDTEYYDLAPFLYESQNPSKDNWKELSLMLTNDEERIFYCSRESKRFENWDSGTYEIWHIETENTEGAYASEEDYFFYGKIKNQKNAEIGWYHTDQNGNILNEETVSLSPLLRAGKTCKVTWWGDIPGQFRSTNGSIKNVSGNSYTLDSLGDYSNNHYDDESVKEQINFTSNFVGWSNYRSSSKSINVYPPTGLAYIQGDPAKTSTYFSGGYFYPPRYSMDITDMYSLNIYGIWCPKNADMYVFAGESYKGAMSSSSYQYQLKSIIVRRDEAFNVSLAGTPSLSGHTFTGWYYTSGTIVDVPLDGTLYCGHSGRVTYVYPKFEANFNTVTFKDMDGTVLKTEEVGRGGAATPPADPSQPGYTFIGWDKELTNITSPTIVTAQYEANQYNLTIDGNGGLIEGSDNKKFTVACNAAIDDLLASAKENAVLKYHTLEGWYTLSEDGIKYPETGNKMPAEDATIYAHWTRNSSLVTYKDWDGNILKTEEVAIGGNATPPEEPNRPGYTFTGWDNNSTGIEDHTTITAQYSVNGYKLILDGNGGTIEGNEKKVVTADYNSSLDQILLSAKESAFLKYHTLEGWYTLPTDGTKYPETGNKMPDGGITAYAHWTRSSSLVTYEDWDGNILKTEEVVIGGNSFPPEVPDHPGYEFIGWDKDITNIQDHTTITAQYKEKTYKLIFEGNGGTIEGNPSKEIEITYNSSIDPLLFNAGNSVALPYHTFDGWYTLAVGGAKYSEIGNKMPAEEVTVYAHWTRSSSLVTYQDWNGEVLKIEEVPMGGNATPPADPNRPGYIFHGWDKESENIQDHVTIIAQYTSASNDNENKSDSNLPPTEDGTDANNTKEDDSDDSNIVYVPTADSTAKPEVPDHGGDFTVNPDNPYDITYTKPDGSKGNNEWVGDGEDWFHINGESKVDYDWYLEKESWYMLNKDLSGKIGAAKHGWYLESMDNKWYYFDTSNTAMKTGWQSIDNKWYYFTEVNNGQTYFGGNDKGWVYDTSRPWKPFGSMFKNEKTPDGYFVDEAGAWIR